MHIEPMSATITFNAPGNPTYCVTCLCDLRYPSPSGLWWIVKVQILPRMRVLHNFAAETWYEAKYLAWRLLKAGRCGAPLAQTMAELTEGNCPEKPDGSMEE